MNLSIADGYGVRSGYTYGYYKQLSPSWLRLVALSRGIAFPAEESLRYFELGFGQGVSLNVHAAANPGEFWGNDYNETHVAFARRMAEASGAGVHLLADSFEQLAARRDLPQFDVVVAHGIWSWIAEPTRAAVLRFLDEHLAPGGLFYVSYNAFPGAASGIAAQRLIHGVMASGDPSLPESDRFEIAREHLVDVAAAPGSHFDHYPKARERLEGILAGRASYLLHEYAGAAWKPELLCEVAAQLQQVGLEFCGSAYLEPETCERPLGATGQDDLVLSETLRDFREDRMFRSDLFVRRPQDSGPKASRDEVAGQLLALTAVPDLVDLSPADPELADNAEPVRALLDRLAGSAGPALPIRDLLPGAEQGSAHAQASQALSLALNRGLVHPARPGDIDTCREAAARLDRYVRAHLKEDRFRQLRVSARLGAAANLPRGARQPVAKDSPGQHGPGRENDREHFFGIDASVMERYRANRACLSRISEFLALE